MGQGMAASPPLTTILSQAKAMLPAYLAGERRRFYALPPTGTKFRRKGLFGLVSGKSPARR